MADIDLYQEDRDDNEDDGYGLDEGLDCDEPFGDDNLTALQKLEKYMESDNVYTRQMVAKGLLDTLRAVGECEEQTTAVLTAMMKLSDDSDPIVRSELMEQIAHIAVYCHDNRDIFHNAIPVYILPMVVRYLDDANNQVRKTSQAALLVLLEQELIDREHIEEQVVSVILELASPDSLDEYRTEAVALMSKMAPLLGNEMTERVFLSRFCEMCTDPLFHVRKVCAANFGDFCSVVSQRSAEQQLLHKFYYLCEDGVWGVRKACAECFMAVSCSCSPEVRKSDLSGVFVNLLCDQSRWVRMAAFQQLGPFISTFADSDLTGIYVEIDGSLVFRPNEDYKKRHLKENNSCENKVSEIQDVDNKSLPDVIVSTQPDTNSASTNPICDNLTPVKMDWSDAVITDDDEEIVAELIGDQSQTVDSAPSNNDLSQVNTELVQKSDIDKSVEEMRAEHYLGTSEENVDNENIGSSLQNVEGETNINSNNIGSAGSPPLAENTDRSTDNHNGDNLVVEQNTNDNRVRDSNLDKVSSESKAGHVHIHLDNCNDFNSFHYWRTPLPQLDLELELVDGTPTNIHVTSHVNDDEQHKVYASEMTVQVSGSDAQHELTSALSDSVSDLSVCDNDSKTVIQSGESEPLFGDSGTLMHTASVSSVTDTNEVVTHMGTSNMYGDPMSETTMTVIDGVVQDLSGAGMAYMDSDISSPQSFRDSLLLDDATLAQQQDIVPQSLLENYLGMIDPSRAQTVDTEITKYCAYNLPAVAYTLGRTNWYCIKNLYETLAADMQWKVRRTLAFSIHELAVILGEEITHRDLVPVFDGFLKDLDEVRIGILRHLADFLRLLHPDVRRQYLIKVQDFMNVDNNRNWRFRMELAEQLVLISELYSAQEISDYLLPLGIALAEDKVSEVRIDAYHLVSVMLKRMVQSNDGKLVQCLVNHLISRFAHNQRWARRQIYTQLCQAIVREEAVEPIRFAKDFLPSLLSLADDNVPNVRIALAKCFTCYMLNEDYSNCDNHPHKDELEVTLKKLQSDIDRDVRYFCSTDSCLETTTIHDTSGSLSDSTSA